MSFYNIDSLLSYFIEDSFESDDFFRITPNPILEYSFSTINKIESITNFNNNYNSLDVAGQIDTKENVIDLPVFYSIDKIINEYIKNEDLKMKLKKGKSIINLTHYKFIELGHKKGIRKNFEKEIKEIVNYDGQHRKRGRKKKDSKYDSTTY